jgi:hypothetical protein
VWCRLQKEIETNNTPPHSATPTAGSRFLILATATNVNHDDNDTQDPTDDHSARTSYGRRRRPTTTTNDNPNEAQRIQHDGLELTTDDEANDTDIQQRQRSIIQEPRTVEASTTRIQHDGLKLRRARPQTTPTEPTRRPARTILEYYDKRRPRTTTNDIQDHDGQTTRTNHHHASTISTTHNKLNYSPKST